MPARFGEAMAVEREDLEDWEAEISVMEDRMNDAVPVEDSSPFAHAVSSAMLKLTDARRFLRDAAALLSEE